MASPSEKQKYAVLLTGLKKPSTNSAQGYLIPRKRGGSKRLGDLDSLPLVYALSSTGS